MAIKLAWRKYDPSKPEYLCHHSQPIRTEQLIWIMQRRATEVLGCKLSQFKLSRHREADTLAYGEFAFRYISSHEAVRLRFFDGRMCSKYGDVAAPNEFYVVEIWSSRITSHTIAHWKSVPGPKRCQITHYCPVGKDRSYLGSKSEFEYPLLIREHVGKVTA